ncbi:S1 family peptidase [Streptomyces lasalocidi]
MKQSGRGRGRAAIALSVAALTLSLPFVAAPSAVASPRPALTAAGHREAAGDARHDRRTDHRGAVRVGPREDPRFHRHRGRPPPRQPAPALEGQPAPAGPAHPRPPARGRTRRRPPGPLLQGRPAHGPRQAPARRTPRRPAPPRRRGPLRITSIGPAVDGSGLEIGYDEDRGAGRSDRLDPLASAARQDRSSELAAVTGRLTGVRTTVAYQPLSVDLSSRQEDGSPWQGGAAVRNPGGGICSSSFAVKTSTGQYEMSTAYHCDGRGGTWHTYRGGRLIGTTDTAQRLASDDALGISLPSGRSAGRLYDGPASETDGYSKPVSGWGHNNVGDYVCTDGANSGVHCGVQIAKTDIGVTGENGVYRPATDLAYATSRTRDGIAAVNGDSGGPVFAGVNNSTADEARGVITALDRTVKCPSSEYVLDSGVRTPWCLQGVYFVPIFQTLHDMKWTLVTG